MRTVTTCLVLLLTLVLAGGVARAAPPMYTALDLGGGNSAGMDVNASGVVVGNASDAFIWTKTGGMTTLGGLHVAVRVTDAGQVVGGAFYGTGWHALSWTKLGGTIDLGSLGGYDSNPTDVNEDGMVVGNSTTVACLTHPNSWPCMWHPFAWTSARGMSDLGSLSLGKATASAVNELGQVVGQSATSDSRLHAVMWSGSIRDLGTLGGPTSSAADINDSGQVVGYSMTTTAGQTHAFSWTASGGMIDLGTLGGSTSHARAVNNAGQVVGWSTTPTGVRHVFSWTPAGGMVDIGTLGGDATSLVDGTRFLNDAGQVVGASITSTGASHAFVWSQATGMIDLDGLGGGLSGADAISENGLITGTAATSPITGAFHAVLWRPVDTTPPTLDVPAALAVDATSPAGAVVTFTVSATDVVDPSPRLTCSPASGTTFGIGTATITCTATDAAGNSATAPFTVHVRGAAEQVAALRNAAASLGLRPPVARSLDLELQRATALLAQDRPHAAGLVLHAFAAEVQALPTFLIAPGDASRLTSAAVRIWTVIG